MNLTDRVRIQQEIVTESSYLRFDCETVNPISESDQQTEPIVGDLRLSFEALEQQYLALINDQR